MLQQIQSQKIESCGCRSAIRVNASNRFRQKLVLMLTVLLGLGGYSAAWGDCSTDGWSNVVDDGDNISPTVDASLESDCGLIIDINQVHAAYVVDKTPGTLTVEPVSQYVARFYLAQNHLLLGVDEELVVFEGLDAFSLPIFDLIVRDENGVRKLKLLAYENGGAAKTNMGSELTLANGWRAVQLEWKAGAGDGYLKLKVDGVAAADEFNLAKLSNDSYTLSEVRLGVVNAKPESTLAGTSGSLLLDAFASYRQGDAGLIDKNCSGDAVPLQHITFLPGRRTCVASTSISTGALVTIDSGSDVTMISPQIQLQSSFAVPLGGTLRVVSP